MRWTFYFLGQTISHWGVAKPCAGHTAVIKRERKIHSCIRSEEVSYETCFDKVISRSFYCSHNSFLSSLAVPSSFSHEKTRGPTEITITIPRACASLRQPAPACANVCIHTNCGRPHVEGRINFQQHFWKQKLLLLFSSSCWKFCPNVL